jgi:hypothetical protein
MGSSATAHLAHMKMLKPDRKALQAPKHETILIKGSQSLAEPPPHAPIVCQINHARTHQLHTTIQKAWYQVCSPTGWAAPTQAAGV